MPTRKWGSEKLANTITAGSQSSSDVAALADGGFVVVWEDESAGTDAAIRAQRYNAAGNAVGGEMLIAPRIVGNNNSAPEVAGLADGNFYVSWTQEAGTQHYIHGKVYNASGGFVRDQPVIFAPNQVSNGDLAAFGGGAAAVWLNPAGNGDIHLRIFNAAGTGPEIIVPVSTYPNGYEERPVVAASPNGLTVAVAWELGESGFTSCPVSLYTAGGAFITTYSGGAPDDFGYVGTPGISWLNDSQFVLVWRNQTDFTSGPADIRLRLLNFNGATVTPAPFTEIVLANATTAGEQQLPVITALPAGGFVVAWVDYSETDPDDELGAIRLQAFDASGNRIGGELVVNTTTANGQGFPSIAALCDGRVAVSWIDFSTGNNDIRVQIVDPRDGVVTGTATADVLYGHDAVDDEISGFNGADLLRGLRGDDQLYGGDDNDDLFGGQDGDVLYGGAGVDTLLGEAGDDDLFGEDGNDDLRGGAGADALDGGTGTDTANYGSSATGVRVALDGSLVATGEAIGDSFTSVEYLKGSNAAGSGDVLRGDGGANALYGNAGADNLNGLAGVDKLVGGLGTDTLTGGIGNDQFIYNLLTELPDVILDFSSNAAGNNDVFLFKGSVFGGLPSGTITAAQFQSSTANVAANGTVRFFYETDTRILRFDADGSGAGSAPVVIATLQVGATMTFQDISIF